MNKKPCLKYLLFNYLLYDVSNCLSNHQNLDGYHAIIGCLLMISFSPALLTCHLMVIVIITDSMI